MRRLLTMLVGTMVVAGSAAAAVDSMKVFTSDGTTMLRAAVSDIAKMAFDDFYVYVTDNTGTVSQRPVGGTGVGMAKFVFTSITGSIRKSLAGTDGVSVPTVSYRPWGASISFGLRSSGNLKVTVYSSEGKQVREVCASRFNAGIHTLSWDGTNADGKFVAPGIYHIVGTMDRSPALNATIIIQ